ncbi:632_t:CDS:2, partial [Acaulospora colombiana]
MTQISTISDTKYKYKASKYVEILNQLRRTGTQFEVNLPTIVFCGNQSAGKSSLLEAISGVALPRSDGTCTRCVMELRLIESEEPWECQISLRHEYDENDKPLRSKEIKFGNKICDPKDVELMARRAQKALLNPLNDSDQYIDWSFENYEEDPNSNKLKFTKNVVCLEIRGKGVPNLSLIDLPGIIRHTEKIEDRKFVQMIEDLVNSYIKKEESIIVATISCKDEIDNQVMVTLAKTVDPLGSRTLGVLTKPDMIEAGTHEPWLKIMRGEAHKLSLGYYIVKNPNKMQLVEKITFEDARKEEDDAHAKLEKIPEPPGKNPRLALYRMIKECSAKIKEAISSDNNTELWNSISNEFKKFKREACSSRSIFAVGGMKFDALKEFINDVAPGARGFNTVITEHEITNIINSSRGKLLPGFTPYPAVTQLIRKSQNGWRNPSHECLTRIYEIITNLAGKELEIAFLRFPTLYSQMEFCTTNLLDDCRYEATKYIDFIYDLEQLNHPFTLDEPGMISKKKNYSDQLYEAVTKVKKEVTDTLDVIASLMT